MVGRNPVNRRSILSFPALILMGLALLPSNAAAQQKSIKDQIVGTWTLVSTTGRLADGSPTWGTNPKTLLLFTDNGRFSAHLMRSDRSKFAANSRLKGTPDENKATVEGTLSYFGTYTISEPDKTITYHIEGSSYPNWNGTDQKRPILSLTADELKYANPAPSGGTAASELLWKRAK
jgi:hypothetical protein